MLKLKNYLNWILKIREIVALITLFTIIFICLALIGPIFLSINNIANILSVVSPIAITATAMTLLMISGEIDLSVGSVMAITPTITSLLALKGYNIFFSALIGIGIAFFIGLINGILVTKFKIKSFIATFGMMVIVENIAHLLTGGWYIYGLPPSCTFFKIFGGEIFGHFPVMAIWLLVIAICLWLLLDKTAFGNETLATGGNKEGAIKVGINTDRVKIINFMLTAFTASFAGIIMLSYIGGIPSGIFGRNLAFDSIAAVIVGGTALSGGSGTIIGTVIGAFIVGALSNATLITSISSYWAMAIVGLIILIAVILNTLLELRRN